MLSVAVNNKKRDNGLTIHNNDIAIVYSNASARQSFGNHNVSLRCTMFQRHIPSVIQHGMDSVTHLMHSVGEKSTEAQEASQFDIIYNRQH